MADQAPNLAAFDNSSSQVNPDNPLPQQAYPMPFHPYPVNMPFYPGWSPAMQPGVFAGQPFGFHAFAEQSTAQGKLCQDQGCTRLPMGLFTVRSKGQNFGKKYWKVRDWLKSSMSHSSF
jgi:hypothetical protein